MNLPGEISIFIISNEPWGKVWYSKQHYANELAKLNFEVYFVNPVGHWKPKHLFSAKVDIQESPEKVRITSYHNNFPVRVFPKFSTQLNDWFNCRKLRKLIGKRRVIFWNFDPFRFAYILGFNNVRKIYHVVDPYWDHPLDKVLARSADLVVVVRQDYHDLYQSLAKKLLLVPHGISENEFSLPNKSLQEALSETLKGCLFFVGTFNRDIDTKLLLELAKELPHKQLVLVGPNYLKDPGKLKDFKELIQLASVHYIPEVEAQQIKYYVNQAAVCLVPYEAEKQSFSRTPLKIINYLSQKKPIVSTVNIAINQDQDILLWTSRSEFIQGVKKCLRGEYVPVTKRIEEELKKISYPRLIENILHQLP